ncbi:histidine-rich glycoprotein-like [Maniola jurtina]|uniref:histidine-rich glycoprotein-like n=1 Tax=Maniola jurtina TaxID=191418 RepID=UPI001E68C816|nr:histidine-rich glycoprotein-like [Maniola jurtina]
MRTAIWVLTLVAIAAAELGDPWVEEEDLDEQYNDYKEENHDRKKRDAYVEGPFEEHVRIKRGWKDEPSELKDRERRAADPKLHQYEVHEHNDEGSLPSPPYEEMLVASAEHYHKVYVAPPKGRNLSPEVQPGPLTFGVNPVPEAFKVAAPVSFSVSHAHQPAQLAPQTAALLNNDLAAAAGHHHEKGHAPYSHKWTQGGGDEHHGNHHAEHGGKTTKGGNSKHYVDKGQKGFRTNHLHRKEYEDEEGLRKKHHDKASNKGHHEEEAFGSRGAHFGEKKGHKKGHKTKGFHNKYHKDEFQKEHKFYDDLWKDGEHHRYGKFNAKHASNESGKKKLHHVNGGHDYTEHGKKGYSNKGHIDADHKGYHGNHGHEEHHQHHAEHGKKGKKNDGSQWGYAKKH